MKVLILTNYDVLLYKFRKELISALYDSGNDIYISLPNGIFIENLKKLGCKYIETEVDSRGVNPVNDLALIYKYNKIVKDIKPDLVITYTIKPNVYGGLICRFRNIKYISNVTGVGTTLKNSGLLKSITLFLYKLGLKRSDCIFFQNEENKNLFLNNNIKGKSYKLVNGSGINLTDYGSRDYPSTDENMRFLTISRIMKDKGIGELLDAIDFLSSKYKNISFDIAGVYSDFDYEERIQKLEKEGKLRHLGFISKISEILPNYHAIIHPSYHEGLSNALLEAAATNRPVIASDIPGCRETFIDGKTGIAVEPKSSKSLIDGIEKFINLPYEEKLEMSENSRKYVEDNFDRKQVVQSYMDEIRRITNNQ